MASSANNALSLLFLIFFSLAFCSVGAWSPVRLLQLGRGQRKRPVPTKLQVLTNRPEASSPSSKTSQNHNTSNSGLRYVHRPQEDDDMPSEAPTHIDGGVSVELENLEHNLHHEAHEHNKKK